MPEQKTKPRFAIPAFSAAAADIPRFTVAAECRERLRPPESSLPEPDSEWDGARGANGWRPGYPYHFHLLSEHDLEELRPFFEALLKQRSEVVRHWYQQYVLHFCDSRALSESEFTRIFESALEHSKSALLGGDMNGYSAQVSRLGELLVEHRMPLEEAIVSFQFLKKSVRSVFPQQAAVLQQLDAIFDKLSHVCVILIVSAYFGSRTATAGERIAAFERAAAHLSTATRTRFHGLVGASAGMRQLYQRIEAAGATSGNLLIVGETGTGKELIARAVHKCGPRANRPFVALNCAALPKDLIESELFGYQRNALSGAITEYLGLFRAAEGGTLFLDEITEMSAETQSKLLRPIQERAIHPVGSTSERPVDVRLVASTNRDAKAAVADGHLREDLYYRLQASVITVPPLRERREDIPLLVEHFIDVFSQNLGRHLAGIEREALDAILNHSWPGNVRELSNAIEEAFTFGKSPLIGLKDLPPTIGHGSPIGQARAGAGQIPPDTFAETESRLIARALQSAAGNKVQAAKQLQISRKKLYAKIAKYKLAAVLD
jgi:transcriptional regulator with PAS, ATPase and Fis domain